MLNRLLTRGILILFTAFVGSCKKDKTPDGPPAYQDLGFKIVAYTTGNWQIVYSDFPIVDVLNCCYARVDSNGLLHVSEDKLTGTLEEARKHNSRVLMGLSVGGPAVGFKSMATTATGRTNFIHAVLETLRRINYDGVDIDWEYPSITDGTDSTYTLLIKELSDSCHNNKKFLSTAITHGKNADGHREAFKTELFSFVDWFNIKAFNDHSPVLPHHHHSPYELAETSLHYWLSERGMPKDKCILGIPAFARSSGPIFNELVVPFSSLGFPGATKNNDSGYVDTHATPASVMVYFNGRPTIKKKAMLAKKLANGIMVYPINYDEVQGGVLWAIKDTLGIK